jgi:translocation and assembly module TamA
MFTWRLLPLAVLAVTACNRGPQRRAGDEYLKAIKVEGNKHLGKRTLIAGLALNRSQKRGRPPDPYLVQVDEDRIRGEYLRNGFLAIDVRSRVERAGDAATVIYTVEEGLRASTKVSIDGIADRALRDKVRAQLPLADGAPFDYATYEEAKELLLGVVADAGYAHAKLDATVYADRANHEALIALDYTLGPLCTFGDLEITGVTGDLAEAVRARVQFKRGDRYSTHAVVQTQRALYGMSRFSTVQVQADDTSEAIVRVKVAVSEAARHEVKLGGGLGIDPTSYEARARSGYSVAGWPFPLYTASLEFRPAYAYLRDGSGWEPRIRALAKLERQDLFWTYARGQVEGGYNYLAVEAYTSYGPRARLGFATPLKTQRLQLRVGWGIERLDFRAISPLIDPMLQTELGLDHTQQVGGYTQSLTIDLRDHPIDTRFGAYAEIRVVEGTRAAGGAYDYLQLVPELRGFLPAGPVVLAGRVRSGVFRGDVPVTERFFSGGASNHRGFGERRLAPTVTGEVDGEMRSVPYGGTAMLETGVEARFPIATWREMGIGGVAFLDGGDVTNDLEQIELTNLHWAAGLGLRVHTIVGPVRFDVGYRLNRHGLMDPAPGSRLAFHLSIGEAF